VGNSLLVRIKECRETAVICSRPHAEDFLALTVNYREGFINAFKVADPTFQICQRIGFRVWRRVSPPPPATVKRHASEIVARPTAPDAMALLIRIQCPQTTAVVNLNRLASSDGFACGSKVVVVLLTCSGSGFHSSTIFRIRK
jgi:hypothetical protein